MSNKSRQTRNGSASRPTPESSDFMDDYTPFRIDTSAPPIDHERIPIFYVDDVEYTIPKRVPAGVAMKALQLSAEQGRDVAAYFMVVDALGQDVVEMLQDSKHLELEDATALFSKLGRMYLGQMEAMAGK